MTHKKVITLEQISKNVYQDNDIDDLDVGDMISNYKVIDIEMVECEHEDRLWRVEGAGVDFDTKVEGRCKICGHTIQLNISALEDDLDSERPGYPMGKYISYGGEE